MTVCIVARSRDVLVCASDRMLTSGDIQFEPNRSKFVALSEDMVAFTSGDASFQALVLRPLFFHVRGVREQKPNEFFPVLDAVYQYVHLWSAWKGYMAEAQLLAPLNLTRDTFIERHKELDTSVARNLTADIIGFDVPSTSTIIAGRDTNGIQIYTIEDGEISAHDTIGFVAIGIGARHAESHLMLTRHSWNVDLDKTILHTYIAKKRAEIAPGVGKDTDMYLVSPRLGFQPVDDSSMAILDKQYQNVVQSETRAHERARKAVLNRLDEVKKELAQKEDHPQDDRPAEDSI